MNMISRRRMVKGLAAGLPLAVVLADPLLARVAAGGLETVTIPAAGRKVSGSLALPAKAPAAAVLLIHEWWGLNDQIKSVAAEFARLGYVALALDMYAGKVAAPGDREAARRYMNSVDPVQGTETVKAWVKWLKAHEKATGKVGTIGWCFGGGLSLDASIATPIDATVVYYGRVDADDLKALKGPVLGHFATGDQWINQKMVSAFEAEMDKAGKAYKSHWYEAQHAFANPTSARYDKQDAKLAWQRTMAFFKENLGG